MAFSKFKGKTFTKATASAGIINRELYRKIPAVLRQGKKSRQIINTAIPGVVTKKATGVTELGGINKSGFFNYDIILSASDKTIGSPLYDDKAVVVIEDSTTKETEIFLTSSLFRVVMNDYLTSSLPENTYQTISKSFFGQIGEAVLNMPFEECYVGILASPFEAGSSGSGTSIMPPPTCSFKIKESPGIAYDTSGNPRARRVTYFNSSSNFTNSHYEFTWHNSSHGNLGYDEKQEAQTDALIAKGLTNRTRSFGQQPAGKTADRFYYVQPKPVSEFSFRMSSSLGSSSFFVLTSSYSGAADFGLVSGNLAGRIDETSNTQPKFYNQSDASDGAYLFVVQKAYIEGEGEFGQDEANFVENDSSLAFSPQKLLVWYSTDYNYSNIRSSSFYFTPYPVNMNKLPTGPTTKNLVTGSISSSEAIGTGELRTLYWLNHTYTGSFTASFGYSTRAQLRNRTGEANHTQLPFMDTKPHFFGKKQQDLHSSHLWKDQFLSIPADEGYYVHSASFSQESKGIMSASLGSANHTSSFYVMGVFTHPFVPAIDTAIINYSASQLGEAGVVGNSFMSHHPIASCIFLKRHDDEVFIFHPSASGFVTSESVG